MRFPKYWMKSSVQIEDARGRTHKFTAWGWSDVSVADAEQKAQQRASRVGNKVLAGEYSGRYGYSRTPLREEVLREYRDAAGSIHSAITVNSYGCQVLNSTAVMFVDVDLQPTAVRQDLLYMIRRLLGMKTEPSRRQREARFLASVESVARASPQHWIRVYRTRAGLRYILDRAIPPSSDEAARLMQELGADPLYMRLCKAQESYRARLTPKPWRCGLRPPANNYPWPDIEERRAYDQWQQEYARVSADYATCEFVDEYGKRGDHGQAEELIALHDSLAKATSGLRLA